MRVRSFTLAAAAMLSMLVGAVYQTPAARESLPLTLFKEAKPEHFIGQTECAGCHEAVVNDFSKSAHATYMNHPSLPVDKQGCEACHGPGKFHLDEENPRVISFTNITPKEVSDACLRCHQDVLTQAHWKRSDHAKANVSCVSCHQIHPEAEGAKKPFSDRGVLKTGVFQAAATGGKLLKGGNEVAMCGSCHQSELSQFKLNSRHPIPEGRMVCTSCHEPHRTKDARKPLDLGKDNCVKCHAETAGPFVFEHDPVAGHSGEGCAECHKPHGSNNSKLLKASSRGLCGQCHTEKQVNHFPGRTCWQAGCHVAVHGSNRNRLLLQR